MFRGKGRAKSPKAAKDKNEAKNKKPTASTTTVLSANGISPEIQYRTHHIVFVFPTFEEFPLEFDVMRAVIAEVQQTLFEYDMDLECTTFVCDTPQNYAEFAYLTELVAEPQTTIACFIGERYGEMQLPLTMEADELNALRAAAVEVSKDANLLDQLYVQSWTAGPHHLNTRAGPKELARLTSVVKKSLQRALEDNTLPVPGRESVGCFHLQSSFIEKVAQLLMKTPNKHLFVLRKFSDFEAPSNDCPWKDKDVVKYERISALKNKISEKLPKESVISNVLNNRGQEPGRWLTGKDAGTYEGQLTMDLLDALKRQVNLLDRPGPSKPVAPLDVALREDRVHQEFAQTVGAKRWLNRPGGLDDRLNELIHRGLEKPLCLLIHGPPGSGKSATAARVHELLAGQNCHVITRFGGLTDQAVFANELFKGIFLTLCSLANQDAGPISACFHLATLLSQCKLLLDKLDRPVFVIVDNGHFVRFGRTLSETETPMRKLLPRLNLIYTAPCADQQLGCFPMADELIELKTLQGEQCLEIMRMETEAISSMPADCVTSLLSQHKALGADPILGRLQAKEALAPFPISFNKLDSFLTALEEQYDRQTVRLVCEMLAIAPFGLTQAEICDGVRLGNFMDGVVTKAQHLFAPTTEIVLRRLRPMLVGISVDGRVAYRVRHPVQAVLIRQRYMPSAAEMIGANQVLADLFKTGPGLEQARPNAGSAGLLNCPPACTRDLRAPRRLKYSWYFLLHSANIDELKSEALCAYPILEGLFRAFGLTRLLTVFEECLQQVLHHDLLVLFEQVLLPAIPTLIHDGEQLVSEFVNRLRYTRSMNSEYLTQIIDDAMNWTDMYMNDPVLVPQTCWLAPPKMKQVVTFEVPFDTHKPILHPTCNHQHLLVAGNVADPGMIYMYHIASQIMFKSFKAHTDRVTSFQTSSDGTFFTSTSWDGSVRVWSILQLECTKTIHPSGSKILCSALAENNNILVTGSADSTARVIDLEQGKVVRSFPDHIGPVVDLKLMSKDELLVTGSGDFAVMVWDLSNGQVITKMAGLMAPVTCLTVTSNDAFMAVACEDETLRVFSTVSTQELHELSGHDSRVNALCSTIDDCKLFAATTKKIVCYDIHNGRVLETLECTLREPVTSLKISDDNAFLIAACGNRMHMWDVNSIDNEPVADTAASLVCMEMAPDERTVACGTEDGVLAVWDLDGGKCLWTTSQQKTGAVTALCFTIDSKFVISGAEQGCISLWEASSGVLNKQFELHGARVTTIVGFQDGNNVLSLDAAETAYIWALASLEDPSQIEVLSSFAGLRAPIYVRLEDSVVVAQSTQNTKELNVWGQFDAVLTSKTKAHHAEEITCYHANGAGNTFVTGSADQSLKVWRMETGFLTQVLVGHEDVVLSCCVSEDGRTVASGGKDRQAFVWDAQTGQARMQYAAKGAITSVQLTGDAKVLISGDAAGWIEAYNVQTQQRLSSFNAHRPVERLVISFAAHRILAKLAHTAQMPILCLHNTPADSRHWEKRRLRQLMSTTSLTNGTEDTMSLAAYGRPRTSTGALNRGGEESAACAEARRPSAAGINGAEPSPPPPQPQQQQQQQQKKKKSGSEKSAPSPASSGAETKASQNGAPPKKSRFCTLL